MERKKITIPILITIVLIVLSHSLFFSFSPINLSFTTENITENTILNIMFAQRTNVSFNRNNSVSIKTTKNGKTINIPLSLYKIGKIQIDFYDKNELSTIKNIRINNGIRVQEIPTEYIKTDNIGGNKSLMIKNIKIYGKPIIDFKILLILLIIYFLTALKLTKYLIDFKIKQNYSRIDIVFLACFFVVLFIPAMNISNEDSDIRENRMLQKYIPFFKDGQINNDFGKNFETYFNDRFFGRFYLIKYYQRLKTMISPTTANNMVISGKNDFLFLNKHNEIKNYQNADMYSETFLKTAKEYLSKINDFCRKNGKQFIFYIAPDKHRIYGENIKHMKKIRPDSESKTIQLIDYLRHNTDITIIYPYKELIEEKNKNPANLLYWKHDTHWSELGAYTGYLELMKKIGITPLKIKAQQKYIKKDGDLAKMFQSYKTQPTSYIKPVMEKIDNCTPSLLSENKPTYCHNDSSNKRIIFFHDSFTENMFPYIARTFKESTFYWRHPIIETDGEYIKEHTDIVVLEIVERLVSQKITENSKNN